MFALDSLTQEEMLHVLEKFGEGDYRPVPLERFTVVMGDSNEFDCIPFKNLFFVASDLDPSVISKHPRKIRVRDSPIMPH